VGWQSEYQVTFSCFFSHPLSAFQLGLQYSWTKCNTMVLSPLFSFSPLPNSHSVLFLVPVLHHGIQFHGPRHTLYNLLLNFKFCNNSWLILHKQNQPSSGILYHASYVEALLCISIRIYPQSPDVTTQIFWYVYSKFNMFKEFHITCICPDCEDYRFSDNEKEDGSDISESLSELQSAENADKEDLISELLEPLSELLTILCFHSAPPQPPPLPWSWPQKVVDRMEWIQLERRTDPIWDFQNHSWFSSFITLSQ